ncbi:MAG: hypothetical protein AAFV93_05045 [Chloroflexota bacterium]
MFKSYLIVITILTVLTLLTLQAQDEDNIEAILQQDMILNSTCTISPCLFGESLQGMSYDEVQRTIHNSSMRDNLILVGAPRRNQILWLWSSEFSSLLGVDTYTDSLTDEEYNHIYEFQGFNTINFSNGVVYSIWLRIETQLSTLIQIYEQPIAIVPSTYNRFGDMTFRIYFTDVTQS